MENNLFHDYLNVRCRHVEESVNIKNLEKKLPNLMSLDIRCIVCNIQVKH
jgi:hypothetical protein